jgi:hypothetical protein
MTSPVTHLASSEARNTATGPMSSGVPRRPRGVAATDRSSISPPIRFSAREPSVSVGPGAMALTRILRAATSLARTLVRVV